MRKIIAVIAIMASLVSCDKDFVFDDYKTITGEWDIDSTVVFKVNAPDTVNAYNLFITMRNDHEYAFNNLFLITNMQFPHGKTITDTLEYEMARPDGSFLGAGSGDIKENKFWYKEGVIFDEDSTYTFSVKHAMRVNGNVEPLQTLKGVKDVGLRIEKISEE